MSHGGSMSVTSPTMGSNAGKYKDRAPMLPAAGKITTDPLDTVEQCVKHDESARGSTPPHLTRFRKSHQIAVGSSKINPAKATDPPPPDIRFGVRNKYNESALDLIQSDKSGFFLQQQQALKEGVYASSRKEPLGKSYVRGHKLPEHAKDPAFRFGVTTRTSESAKGIIYPPYTPDEEEEQKSHEQYCRTHNSYKAGEQKKRGYDWKSHKIDPAEMRFGYKEHNATPEGVKQAMEYSKEPRTVIVKKTLEDFKEVSKDMLGQPKNHGFGEERTALPETFTFGKTTKGDDWGTKECIQGIYTDEDRQPDKDLGKATRPGYRNDTSSERVFGVPTIRTDLPRPKHKKVTDNNNYGDDCNTRSLLCPSKFATDAVHEEDFLTPITREEMYDLAQRCKFDLEDSEFDQAWDLAMTYTSDGSVSIETFRRAVDELGL